jgi:hypothetical protein
MVPFLRNKKDQIENSEEQGSSWKRLTKAD